MDYTHILERFSERKILVIGDIMLDHYILGDVDRISVEAPVPIVKVKSERYIPGGAANVAANVASLGARVDLIGIIGRDHAGEMLSQAIISRNVRFIPVIIDNIPTIQKIRITSGYAEQQLMRLDREDIKSGAEKELLLKVEEVIDGCDAVIISDYAKGAMTKELAQKIISFGKPVLVDTKPKNKEFYKGAFLIKTNHKEAEAIIHRELEAEEDVREAGKALVDHFCSNILITLGPRGMSLFEVNDGNHMITVPSKAREVYDVSGAGDTVIATFALSHASGASLIEATEIANHAAGIVVQKKGTATVSTPELIAEFAGEESKIKTLQQLLPIVKDLKSKHKKIVFTNGCFDIMHTGHAQVLKIAKNFGDILIVALNSDASVRKLKGPNRPIIPEHERLDMMAAIQYVDYVILFNDDTPIPLIQSLQPDIHVKGGDYKMEQIGEAKYVTAYGGEVKIVKLIEGHSTTNIISKIKSQG